MEIPTRHLKTLTNMEINKNKTVFDRILDKWWLRHTLFWVVFMIYYMRGMLRYPKDEFTLDYVLGMLTFLPGHFMVVYTTIYLLIPKYLIHRKIPQFLLGYIAVIGIAIFYAQLFQLNWSQTNAMRGVSWLWGKNVLPFVHCSAIAAFLKMLRYAFLQERREKENKAFKNIAELELLKAQIHPHFLFNTLNNLFAHTLKKSPHSSKIVVKLSDLLRFMVYESREDEIELKKEIKLLNDYIDLEKLRYGNELDVSTNFSGDIEINTIRPLLLMPLIENSFKHGTSQQLDQKWISLNLHIEGDLMEFNLANSRDKDSKSSYIQGKNKGIGLINVQRRLELLYPGLYEFKVTAENDRFLVYLRLRLKRAPQSGFNLNGNRVFSGRLTMGS
jgi:sensor histidine kinase YesM